MSNVFSQNQRLPATRKLKISWAEEDLETLLTLKPSIRTNRGSYDLVKTVFEAGSGFDNYLITIGTVNLVAGWPQQYALSPTWYLSCGELGRANCGSSRFVMLDTSQWDYMKRTVYSINSGASEAGFTWEDMDPCSTGYVVSFNSHYGSPVEAYERIEAGSTIEEPDEPYRELHSFVGWYKDADYAEAWDFSSDTVDENLVLHAKWENALDDIYSRKLRFDVLAEVSAGEIQPGDTIPEGADLTDVVEYLLKRKVLYGYSVDANTSEGIRSLQGSVTRPVAGDAFSIVIPAGATNVVFAYPDRFDDIASVIQNGMFDITGQFIKRIVEVDDLTGNNPMSYKVFMFTPIEPFQTDETYEVTL